MSKIDEMKELLNTALKGGTVGGFSKDIADKISNARSLEAARSLKSGN